MFVFFFLCFAAFPRYFFFLARFCSILTFFFFPRRFFIFIFPRFFFFWLLFYILCFSSPPPPSVTLCRRQKSNYFFRIQFSVKFVSFNNDRERQKLGGKNDDESFQAYDLCQLFESQRRAFET